MKLREYMETNKLKPCLFARKAGLSPQVVTRFIRGDRDGLSLKSALLISAATGGVVSVDELFRAGADRVANG